jgi:NAD(P)-dependent dehydrogenase (short-subunit alcohol dehydrogenase family)
VFLCAREAAKHMIAVGRGGRIVNTASIMGLSGGGLYPNVSYQSTKGAVVNMTRAFAIEWARQGIRVNGIAPGPIAGTEGVRRLTSEASREGALTQCPLGRLGTTDDIANAALFLCSGAAAYVNGVTLVVDGGLWLRSARILGA